MTKYELDNILKTLPIGYYLGRDISVTSDETEETSFYNPAEDKIVISLKIINNAINRYPTNYDLETAVRSMLYHEISHVFMTCSETEWTDVYNVFEDERIETLLANYYMDVDFKKQVFAINDFHGQAPKDGWDYFYQLVRFRKGDKEDLVKVNNIINAYKTLTANYDYLWWHYLDEVRKLYERCEQKYGASPHHNKPEKCGKATAYPNNNTNMNGGNDTPTQIDTDLLANAEAEINAADEKPYHGRGCGLTANKVKNIVANIGYYNETLTDNIRQIFNSFKSRQLNNGNAMNGYSGIFDPRSVLRDDYKYFIRQNSKGNGKGFSRFNLNLFIDCSGSYCHNVKATNTILKSLETIEKENPMFSFSVFGMNDENFQLPKENRYIEAEGGTRLTPKIVDLYRKNQRGDAVNYNIVLFDGQTDNDRRFDTFNNNNVSIISDDSNAKAINKYAPKAKAILLDWYATHKKSYADRLYDNILNILKTAFM